MKKLIILALGVLALWAWSGCASREPLRGLTVEITGIERTTDGQASVSLRFVNTTVMAINLAKSTHKIFLNGRPAGTLVLDDSLGIPPQTTIPQTGTLKLEGGLSLPAGETPYQIESELTIRTYGTSKEIQRMSDTGTVTVK